jgi:hypothetical protein
MRDPDFKQEQLDGLRAPHVAPINALVDELRDPDGRGWVPYVAPVYGGIYARVLCIQSDPGRMTRSQHGGSGLPVSAGHRKRFGLSCWVRGGLVAGVRHYAPYPR